MSHTYFGPAYRIESERLVIRCYDPKDALLLQKSVQESVEIFRFHRINNVKSLIMLFSFPYHTI